MNRGLKMMAVSRPTKNDAEMRRPRMGYDDMESREYSARNDMEMRGRPRDRRGRFTGEMEMNRPYGYAPHDDMESRFRDNRRSEYRGDMNVRNDMESHWYPQYYEESEMEMNRYGRNEMEGNGRRNGMEMERRNPVGFNAHFDSPGKADASYHRMQEGNQMHGPSMHGGGAKSHGSSPKFNEKMAREWTAKMQNEDGTKGPHWTIGQIREVLEDRGITGETTKWWAVMNMMYSDYCNVAKKLGINIMDFCVEMTKAFCEDKDAGAEDKVASYYEHVVKG